MLIVDMSHIPRWVEDAVLRPESILAIPLIKYGKWCKDPDIDEVA